ncbi:MAG: 3-deoxy-D-manno-octulosonic acid transferase [Pirellulales bacterium]
MLVFLCDLAYLALLILVSPWLVYQAITTGKYREGYGEKLWGRVPIRRGERQCVWLHAVSVGEVNVLVPLVDEIRRRYPDWQVVISSTSQTGHALAVKKFSDLTVFYCPVDFSWSVRNAMRRMRPNLLVLAELELWPNLIRAAREFGAGVAIVNGRLSEGSLEGYSWIKPVVQHVLQRIDLIGVQDETYANRFRRLGAPHERVHVTGSVKYDGAIDTRDNPHTLQLARLAGITSDDVVFLAGSTQEGEEALALAAYRSLKDAFPQLRLIVVPRHPERFAAVAQELESARIRWQRRSRLEQDGPDPKARVLLVDAMGELGAWWGTAAIAFVGGSLVGSRGGQNMIEPAAYGCAVCFGPDTRNFRDIVTPLVEGDAAQVVHNGDELTRFVQHCLGDPGWAVAMGSRARQLVGRQVGATARTVDLLAPLIEPAAAKTARPAPTGSRSARLTATR